MRRRLDRVAASVYLFADAPVHSIWGFIQPGGVIGNTTDSGSVILGSSPSRAAAFRQSRHPPPHDWTPINGEFERGVNERRPAVSAPQRAKNFRGKMRYFGTDEEAALKKWAQRRDCFLAGVEPPQNDTRASVVKLANLFAANCRRRVEAGEIEQRSADVYRKSIRRLIKTSGASAAPAISSRSTSRPSRPSWPSRLSSPPESKRKGGKKIERRPPGSVGGGIRRLRGHA